MPIAKIRTFRGDSQAIRLPKDIGFADDVELMIVRSGDVVTIYPAVTTIPSMIAELRALSTPPGIEQRDVDALPERSSL